MLEEVDLYQRVPWSRPAPGAWPIVLATNNIYDHRRHPLLDTGIWTRSLTIVIETNNIYDQRCHPWPDVGTWTRSLTIVIETNNIYDQRCHTWPDTSIHWLHRQLSCCQTLNINNIFWSVSFHSRKSTCQHLQHTCQHPQHTCLHVIMSGPWLPAPPVTVRNSVQPLPGTKSEFASIQSDFAQDRNFFLDKVEC